VVALALQVEDLVVVMDEGLREHASGIAQQLRRAGRRVDLVLESKKMKWVFKVSLSLICGVGTCKLTMTGFRMHVEQAVLMVLCSLACSKQRSVGLSD